MKRIFDMFRLERSRFIEKINEDKKLSLLKDKNEKELILEMNIRLETVEKALNNLIITLNELVKTQIESQEVIVQLATSTEEMAYLFDNKSIMINVDPEMLGMSRGNAEEELMSFSKDVTIRKKMMN